jgi:predicted DNA repair protein MutK
VQHGVEAATGALGGALGWLTYATMSAILGLILGAIVAFAVHNLLKLRTGAEA